MRVAIALLAGCNQVWGLSGTKLPADAAPPPPPPGCSGGAFGGVIPLPEFDGGQREFEPTIRRDLLELWFEAQPPGGGRIGIWRATRPDTQSMFGAPEPASFSSTADDRSPSITGDGLRMLFRSTRAGGSDLWEVTRPTLDGPFGTPRAVPIGKTVLSIDISYDGLTLYLNDTFNPDAMTFEAKRDEVDTAFSAPVAIVPGATVPSISPDALELFYNPPGTHQLTRLVRASPADAFVVGSGVLLFDSGEDPDLSHDGRTIVFARNQSIQMLQRDCP